ncbi:MULTISPECIES: hypothetical protein [unclassified Clostridium]|nr:MULTISPECIES: hypothetical protein [unclassified Clostridium]
MSNSSIFIKVKGVIKYLLIVIGFILMLELVGDIAFNIGIRL